MQDENRPTSDVSLRHVINGVPLAGLLWLLLTFS